MLEKILADCQAIDTFCWARDVEPIRYSWSLSQDVWKDFLFFFWKFDSIFFAQLNKGGIVMKTALISAVYRKSLKIQQPNGESDFSLIAVTVGCFHLI